MSIAIIVSVLIVFAIIVIVGYGISIFNSLVSLKNNVANAWANIDVLLKQRHDELPKLVATCQEYKNFEQETLEKVTQARGQAQAARSSGDVAAIGASETVLRQAVGGLFAVAENYPDLKANTSFMQLQGRITDLENQIADRREFYNDTVNVYNINIQQFPGSIVAKRKHFEPAKPLEFAQAELADVDVHQLFKS
jgi:LemA protein